MHGAYNHTSRDGIADDEWLLPEMFKDRGYATAGMGKWHLGTRMKFHPLRHGFDEWFGIPYSNDNSKYHPSLAAEMPPLPFYDGEQVIERDPDQSQFTKRITDRAVDFMERNASRPFFLYLPHVMPHVPIFASQKFQGRSAAGLYGDVIEELDWSVGEVLATIRRLKLDERTLVIFISDNGPFLSYGEHAGSAAPLREGKLTTFEGGVRVPCLVRWPGRVPAGRVCAEPFIGIDWLPTLAEIVGGKSPTLTIDGRSAKGLILGEPGADRCTKRCSSTPGLRSSPCAAVPGNCTSRIRTSLRQASRDAAAIPRIGVSSRQRPSSSPASKGLPPATAIGLSSLSCRCSISKSTPANGTMSPASIPKS